MNCHTEKQNQIQLISRMFLSNKKLHIASHTGSKPGICNVEINGFRQKYSGYSQLIPHAFKTIKTMNKSRLEKIVDKIKDEKCPVHQQSSSFEIYDDGIIIKNFCCSEFYNFLTEKIQEGLDFKIL